MSKSAVTIRRLLARWHNRPDLSGGCLPQADPDEFTEAVPSPEEIRRRCLEIQATWSPAEKARRAAASLQSRPVEIPTVPSTYRVPEPREVYEYAYAGGQPDPYQEAMRANKARHRERKGAAS